VTNETWQGRRVSEASGRLLSSILQETGASTSSRRRFVRKNIEFRIKDFGIFTEEREVRMKDFLSFGISEIMAMCVSKGILDCAVTVCDGSGTAVVDDRKWSRASEAHLRVGADLSAPQGQLGDGQDRVLDPNTAKIDQVAGARKAWDMDIVR
jgi:hypothetical protein